MKNFLAWVGALILSVAGVGWYLGWYAVEKGPSPVKGQKNFQVQVSTEKIEEDTRKIGSAIRSLWTAKREPSGGMEAMEMVGPPPELVGPPQELAGPPADQE